MQIILGLLISFFLGSIPFGFLITYFYTKEDIRKAGSGNIGATNVSRKIGLFGGFLTFLLDFLKGYFSIFIIKNLTHYPYLIGLAGAFAVLGHCFTPFLRFNGGKGVSTSFGVFFNLAPVPSLICLFVFLFILFSFKFVSLSSIISSTFFPVISYIFKINEWYIAFSVCISILIIFRHRENIKRIIQNREPKIWKGK